ncbi:MAG: rod shape-determining protein [Firmicutes bacterium]|nr:rod shape-determining protein [Bacillota bacterium]
MNIALDIGTSNTSIFVSGGGVVLREPSVVALVSGKNKIRAVGFDAAEMQGLSPDNIDVITPVSESMICGTQRGTQAAVLMLRKFLEKITPSNALFYPRFRGVLASPSGIGGDERLRLEKICATAGIVDVAIVDGIILAALGANLPITKSFGGLIVDIGGGTTKIASLSMCNVLQGCVVSIGGDMMDKALGDLIESRFGCRIGINTLRRIKTEVGSLHANDTAHANIRGVDIENKELKTFVIGADDVAEACRGYYQKISDSIITVLNKCSPAVVAEVDKQGIYVVGGAASIKGLQKFMTDKLKINVTIPEDPHLATVIGAGKLLEQKELLGEMLRGRKK